jgi:hypothetical protein
MNADEWGQIIFKALGISDAVSNKETMAVELLAARSELPEVSVYDADERAGARERAASVVFEELPTSLAGGALDRALVGLQAPSEAAAAIVAKMPEGGVDRKARIKVLEYLLPRVIEQANRWSASHNG